MLQSSFVSKHILDSFPVEVVRCYEITDDSGKLVLGKIGKGADGNPQGRGLGLSFQSD
jgi:hypothetical protein